jgi:hypothetical protein
MDKIMVLINSAEKQQLTKGEWSLKLGADFVLVW